MLLRVRLEFVVHIWYPHTKYGIDKIERIRKCFIRMSLKLENIIFPTFYEYWCIIYKLEPLCKKRTDRQRLLWLVFESTKFRAEAHRK